MEEQFELGGGELSIPLGGIDSNWWNDVESFGFNELAPIVPQTQSAPPQASPECEEIPAIPARLPSGNGSRAGRVRSTAFFVTYSQSALARDVITQWFSRQVRVKRVVVGQEHHQDGNLHWHVLIEFDSKKEIKPATHFNIEGEHPNIKVWLRSEGSTYEQWFLNHWKYCKKEDPTPFIVGQEPSLKESRKRKRDDVFGEAMDIARTESVKAAMDFLESNCPYDLCTKYDQIHRTMNSVRNSWLHVQLPARAVSEFKAAPKIIDNWRCLYINGATGTGKTAWARSLLPEATVVRHRDQLRDCDFSKGVIFDDFEVAHWPPTAVIHLLDWDEPSGIDVKHAHVVIPCGTRKIFTHNGSIERWLSKDATEEQVSACKRRIHVVNIHCSLF